MMGSAAAAAGAGCQSCSSMQSPLKQAAASAGPSDQPSEQKHCRHCYSPSLVVDWSQGDRVCTTCGIVDEQQLRYDGPEWRDFTNDDDNGPSTAARSGLIPTDETRWLGGLQPTTLSRHPYGGAYGPSNGATAAAESRVRRSLLSTSRKLDNMMEKKHREQMEEARLARRVMARRRRETQQAKRAAMAAEAEMLGGTCSSAPSQTVDSQSNSTEQQNTTTYVTEHPYAMDDDLAAIGREHLDLVEKDEEAQRLDSAAILSEKWSLDRAILLHGTHDEQRHDNSFHPIIGHQHHRDIEEERKQLNKKLDAAQRAAASDLYRASRILLDAARMLDLPDKVINEATVMLCKYAAVKDGFKVRGVTSRTNVKSSAEEVAKQRSRNRSKQMAALASAFVYLSAKKLGHGRSLKDVCSSFRSDHADDNNEGSSSSDESFIKPKHCSRAMTEIKVLFSDYVKAVVCPTAASQNAASTSSTSGEAAPSAAAAAAAAGFGPIFSHRNETEINTLVNNAARKLELPTSAATAIRRLAVHCLKEQIQLGHGSGTKPATLCAALTHLICLAGSSMQKLAGQALAPSEGPQLKRKYVRAREIGRPAKKQKTKEKETESIANVVNPVQSSSSSPSKVASADKETPGKSETKADFDVMSHAPVHMHGEVMSKSEQEMLQVWDVWYSQKSWTRDIEAIADSYSSSQAVLLDYYKKNVHYRRKHLLELLQADSISDSRTTTILLKRIAAAAMLIF